MHSLHLIQDVPKNSYMYVDFFFKQPVSSSLNIATFTTTSELLYCSKDAMEASQSFMTSVVVGKDIVPRIGLHQLEMLRHQLTQTLHQSQQAKVGQPPRTIAGCCWQFVKAKCQNVKVRTRKTSSVCEIHTVDITLCAIVLCWHSKQWWISPHVWKQSYNHTINWAFLVENNQLQFSMLQSVWRRWISRSWPYNTKEDTVCPPTLVSSRENHPHCPTPSQDQTRGRACISRSLGR